MGTAASVWPSDDLAQVAASAPPTSAAANPAAFVGPAKYLRADRPDHP